MLTSSPALHLSDIIPKPRLILLPIRNSLDLVVKPVGLDLFPAPLSILFSKTIRKIKDIGCSRSFSWNKKLSNFRRHIPLYETQFFNTNSFCIYFFALHECPVPERN